ncbi:TauD/TfdA family dioxygenase [Pseudomonas sp.]|uniref:TauD/TfdA family dioxygenase n=1 Tax=Pseudomonas sp. TaxID=306 RepID=UPI002FC58219
MSASDYPVSHSVVHWPREKKTRNSALQLDQCELAEKGFQLIRRYGTDVSRFERDLDRISGGQLYYSSRMGALCHQYSVLPESANFSEQMLCGGFHTDFMFQPHPPAYIALLCLQPDPRHPLYGRNQVVHVQSFLERMQQIFGVSEQDLKEYRLVYDLAERGRFEQPILEDLDGKLIFRFHERLLAKGQMQGISAPDMSVPAMLHAVMMDVTADICLDRGDLLILSNHYALHRRGECSIEFEGVAGKWHAREMATIRFNL